jgi:carbonic anhydrase
MTKPIPVNSRKDLLPEYLGTPIEQLFAYHNFDEPLHVHTKPELVIGMCMDNRKQLRLPENFAYILRTGGGNLRGSEFKVSYAVGIGKVKYLALIAHNNCGMSHLVDKKEDFIEGLVKVAKWDKAKAEEHFMQFAPMFEIGDEIEFVMSETKRLQDKYPGIKVVPLIYLLEDNRLYLLK